MRLEDAGTGLWVAMVMSAGVCGGWGPVAGSRSQEWGSPARGFHQCVLCSWVAGGSGWHTLLSWAGATQTQQPQGQPRWPLTTTPGVAVPSLGLQVVSSSERLGLRKAQGGPTAGRLGHPQRPELQS